MSSRILTSHFSGLEEFLQQHAALLAKSTDGTVAVFANNAPAFYALTPDRLAQLLELGGFSGAIRSLDYNQFTHIVSPYGIDIIL